MASKPKLPCDSCGDPTHPTVECPGRRPCPRCKAGYKEIRKVKKESINKGRLFYTCSDDCGYFSWVRRVGEGTSCFDGASARASTNQHIGEEGKDYVESVDARTIAKLFEKAVKIAHEKGGGVEVKVSEISVKYFESKK
jgi:hypothetical protein